MYKLSLITALVNLLINSIPEEICAVTLCLIFYVILDRTDAKLKDKKKRKYELLKINASNIKRMAVPILTTAILSNILRYILIVDPNLILPVFLFALFLSFIVAYRIYTVKNISRAFVATLLCVFCNIALEFVFYSIFLTAIKQTVKQLNYELLLSFASTLPIRIIELAIINYLIKRKTSIVKVNLWRTIWKNKTVLVIAILSLLFNIVWIRGFGQLFIFGRILEKAGEPITTQIFGVLGIVLVPVVTIIALLAAIYSLKSKEAYDRKVDKEKIRDKINIARHYLKESSYANSPDYGKINNILTELDELIDDGEENI